jgi:hypothetical protein
MSLAAEYRRSYRPKRLFSRRSKAQMASDAAMRAQNSNVSSKISATTASNTHTIAAICRGLLIQPKVSQRISRPGGGSSLKSLCLEDRRLTPRKKSTPHLPFANPPVRCSKPNTYETNQEKGPMETKRSGPPAPRAVDRSDTTIGPNQPLLKERSRMRQEMGFTDQAPAMQLGRNKKQRSP